MPGILTDVNSNTFSLPSSGVSYNLTSNLNMTNANLSDAILRDFNQIGADIDGEAADDQSGYSVSLNGDGTIVAIGAIYSNSSGHVRVYEISGNSWNQIGADIDGEAANDFSGYSVSLNGDGTIVAIGAIYSNGTDSGYVRVYEISGNSWIQIGADIDGEAANDQSGFSVSLSSDGTIVAIGARLNDGSGNNSGHVRVYEISGNSWIQIGADIDGEAANDQSGGSVSLSSDGTIVAIGALLNDGDNGDYSGHVRVYQRNIGNTNVAPIGWTQLGADIDGEAIYDRSGYSVSLSSNGTIVAIGAQLNDGSGNNSGHVRVYEYNGVDTWTKLGEDIDGEAANDESGGSVSLSSDGTIVAIGARLNDGNGNDSGHVRVYEISGNSWIQIGADIDGEAAGNISGYSVSLSSDGTIVAIGAHLNDGNGTMSGHVRVHELKLANLTGANLTGASGTGITPSEGTGITLPANWTIVAGVLTYTQGGGGGGDPFVWPVYGNRYETPMKQTAYRMLQGKKLIMNMSQRKMSKQGGEVIKQYYKQVRNEEAPKSLVTEGVYINKAYLKSDGQIMEYDFDTGKGQISSNYFTIKQETKEHGDGAYLSSPIVKQIIVSFNHSIYGRMTATLNHYSNPQMKSGVTIHYNKANHATKELTGLLVREYKCKSMECRKLHKTKKLQGKVGTNKVLGYLNDTPKN